MKEALIIFMALAASAVQASNLVANGEFESPAAGSEFTHFNASTVFGGVWHVGVSSGGGAVAGTLVRNNPIYVIGGLQSWVVQADLGNGTLSQSVPVFQGMPYSLNFDYRLVDGSGRNPNSAYSVSWTINDHTETLTGTLPGQNFSGSVNYPFVASANDTLLKFANVTLPLGGNTGGFDFVVDNVSVVLVPEPSTTGMLLGGVVAAVYIARRRK